LQKHNVKWLKIKKFLEKRKLKIKKIGSKKSKNNIWSI
jgi:hypothetical protein